MMGRVIGYIMVALIYSGFGMSSGIADPSPQKDVPQPMLIADLQPKLDGKEVTIKFTVAALDGIAQLTKEGQALSFLIETESGTQENRLSVWVEGELANVLENLQMSYLQENQLKVGTTIVATGVIRVHTMDSHLYFLSVTKWKNFRILPSKDAN
jgi:primosomal replication protein N